MYTMLIEINIPIINKGVFKTIKHNINKVLKEFTINCRAKKINFVVCDKCIVNAFKTFVDSLDLWIRKSCPRKFFINFKPIS